MNCKQLSDDLFSYVCLSETSTKIYSTLVNANYAKLSDLLKANTTEDHFEGEGEDRVTAMPLKFLGSLGIRMEKYVKYTTGYLKLISKDLFLSLKGILYGQHPNKGCKGFTIEGRTTNGNDVMLFVKQAVGRTPYIYELFVTKIFQYTGMGPYSWFGIDSVQNRFVTDSD